MASLAIFAPPPTIEDYKVIKALYMLSPQCSAQLHVQTSDAIYAIEKKKFDSAKALVNRYTKTKQEKEKGIAVATADIESTSLPSPYW
jgi:hypothetical protein